MKALRQSKRKSKEAANDGVKVKGFFRLNIVENGKVVGDSGWLEDKSLRNGDGMLENQIVDLGYSHYLVDLLGQGASSKQISRMMLGTGTAPAAAATTLPGELNTATYTRTTVTFANVASKTARFTATFASANSHITAAVTLQNIGIINNTTSAGTLMAGQTYNTSQWNTNQDINATYEIRFA